MSLARSSSSPDRRRRPPVRAVPLDRALEALPLFRLSDSSDEAAVTFTAADGGRWRVLPAPGERVPGTFDQDVYVELCRRWHEAGAPEDGVLQFTLHAFLRSMGRRVDGRTYEQLRGALSRLHRTTLESHGAYWDAVARAPHQGTFTVLSSVAIDRRREVDRDQLALFATMTSHEPGDARVVLHPLVRGNLGAGHVSHVQVARWGALSSPVARRLYRLLEVARAARQDPWRLPLEDLAARLPLTQRYPSHLQRVLQPAHEMLLAAGLVRHAEIGQDGKAWVASYQLAP